MSQTFLDSSRGLDTRRRPPAADHSAADAAQSRGPGFSNARPLPGEIVLRRDVLGALVADPLVSSRHVVVAVFGDSVLLSGHVISQTQKLAATAAVRRVKGAGLVANDLVVAVPCPSAVDGAGGVARPTRLTL